MFCFVSKNKINPQNTKNGPETINSANIEFPIKKQKHNFKCFSYIIH